MSGTSVDGEVLHGDGRGHSSDVVQVLFSQTGRGAAHRLGLSVQGEKTCRRQHVNKRTGSESRDLVQGQCLI